MDQRNLLAFCLVAAAGLASSVRADSGGVLAWKTDFKRAQREAQKAGRPLMVDFWAEWCDWCHKLDATTYRDARVIALSAHFVPVKVNTEGSLGEQELADRYSIETLPTVAFVSPGGRMFFRRNRYEGPEQFPATLQTAQRLAAEVAAFEQVLARNGKDPAALAGLGALLAEQRELADARPLLREARKLDAQRPTPERQRTRRLLATAERFFGKLEDAERLQEEARALGPSAEGGGTSSSTDPAAVLPE